MKSTAIFYFLIVAIPISAGAQELATQFNVKYISNENVYIDAGLSEILAAGDRLDIIKGDSVFAVLEVVFAAEHSASCKIISANGAIQTGDKAVINSRARRPNESEPREVQTPAQPEIQAIINPAITAPKPPLARISGGASIQMHNWDDRSESNLDFSQPSFRLNFKANRLWEKDLSINMRITTRYNKRTREYSGIVPRTEWRNRIYQLSFAYGNERAPFSFEAGRVISNKISGIGYIDGMIVQKSISIFRAGIFAGTQPEWQYSDFQTSIRKYGGYINYTAGDFKTNRLESTVAAAGEYHGGTVSRELLFIRNNATLSGRWNFYQSAEIDLNRGWKKEKTGKSFNLSNLYISGRGKFTNWLSAGVSIDNRRNYWTYESRTLADSLFDDVLRRGLRTDLYIRPYRELFLSGNFGFLKRTGDKSATYSYSFGLNKTNLFSIRQSLNLQYAGFTGPFTDGYNFSARFNRTIGSGGIMSLGYGAYIYRYGDIGNNRVNDWVQAAVQFDIYRRVYSSIIYEYDMGDDIKGNRVIAELGYRF